MFYVFIILIIVLFGLQFFHRKLKKGYELSGISYPYKKRLVTISSILLLAYLTIISSTVKSSLNLPSVGNLNLFVFFIFIPSTIYQIYFLTYYVKNGVFPKSTWLHRFILIIIGLFLSIMLSKHLEKLAMSLFSESKITLVNAINSSMPKPCNMLESYQNDNNITKRFSKAKELYFNSEFFILSFHGGSIDIDGSTIFYRSDNKEWDIFHNDDINKIEDLQKSNKTLDRCVYPNG